MHWGSILIVIGLSLSGCAAARTAQKSCRNVIDWNTAAPEKERAIWLAYLMFRANYRGPAKECSARQTVVAPTFDEEVDARTKTVSTYRNLKARDLELDVRYFNELVLVDEAGFMREYVWLYLRQPTWKEPPELKLADFEQWSRANLVGHRPQTQGSIATVEE